MRIAINKAILGLVECVDHPVLRAALCSGQAPRRRPDPEFDDAMRELLEDFGITPKELAAALGVSVPTISRWRSGVSTPKPRQRKRLLDLREKLVRGEHERLKAFLERAYRKAQEPGIEDIDELLSAIAREAQEELHRYRRERRRGPLVALAELLLDNVNIRALRLLFRR